jgi:AcrR family transcriptional regulator
MNESGKARRPYASRLRERQQDETRNLILQALGEEILRSRPGEFSLPEVAERAGVSVRTVYRHFGSREQLVEAMQAYAVRRVTPAPPTTLEELLAFPPKLFATFDAHAPWVEAMVRAGVGSAVRSAGKPGRIALFKALTAPAVAHLPPEEALAVQALVKHLVSAETWLAMREDFGVSGEAAGHAVSRTLRALLGALPESS